MEKIMKLLVCFLFVIFLQSCIAKQKLIPSPIIERGELVYQLPDSKLTLAQQELKMKFVHLIPEHLATPQQKELKKKLSEAIYTYVRVVKNKMVLQAKKEDFVQIGIPVYYYDRLKYELKMNNRFIRENKIDNIDTMYQKTLESYR